ncbi:MAG: hypothetical protein U9R70_05700 [Pseudomonadota bacterium]|nr:MULTISPECIES: hypothetical protein [unclassified Brevundimonas]MEA3472901.1 hypothetical protein [Pseudomonadota bacterium]
MIVMTTGLSALMALMRCETRPVEPPRLDAGRANQRQARPKP